MYIALKIMLWWHMNCLLSTHRSQLAVTEESRQSGWQADSQFWQVLTSNLEQFWQVSIFIVNITSKRSFSATSAECIHKCSDYFIYFIKSMSNWAWLILAWSCSWWKGKSRYQLSSNIYFDFVHSIFLLKYVEINLILEILPVQSKESKQIW